MRPLWPPLVYLYTALPVLRNDVHRQRGVQADADVAVTGPLFVALAD